MEESNLPLLHNDFLYTELISDIKKTKKVLIKLQKIQRLVRLATLYHPGRMCDGGVENICLEIGLNLTNLTAKPNHVYTWNALDNESNTLHIVTTVYNVGGHSRVLSEWASISGKKNFIILTHQTEEIPEYLKKHWQANGIEFIVLDNEFNLLEKAIIVRELAQNMHRIILHQHPNDVIPILALAKEIPCPVAMFNHAHFTFSLGSSVADLYINTTSYYKKNSLQRRFAKEVELLITPMLFNLEKKIDKGTARHKHGIPKGAFVALTMGQEGYYRPNAQYNFFITAKKLLDNLAKLYIITIGIEPNSYLIPNELLNHKRALFLGKVINPSEYIIASDIFLESFPFPSLGSVIQSVATGELYPVLCWREKETIIHQSFENYLIGLRQLVSEEEYYKTIIKISQNLNDYKILGVKHKEYLQNLQSNTPEMITRIYLNLDKLEHIPRSLPITKCEFGIDDYLLANLRTINLSLTLYENLPLLKAFRANIRAIFAKVVTVREFLIRTAKAFIKYFIGKQDYIR